MRYLGLYFNVLNHFESFESLSGMSRDEIRDKYPEVYEARQRDKLNFRYADLKIFEICLKIGSKKA